MMSDRIQLTLETILTPNAIVHRFDHHRDFGKISHFHRSGNPARF
jgi:hypothetical protein